VIVDVFLAEITKEIRPSPSPIVTCPNCSLP